MKKFLKENKWNIIGVTLLALLIYSYKLFNYSFSIDTEVMINNPQSQMRSWMITGRWSLYFTKFIFHLIPINITLTNILAVLFLILNSVMWTYYLESISSIKNYKYNWIFMCAIVSSPILCEQIGFTLQAFEVIFGMFIMSLGMIFLERWLKDKKSKMTLFFANVIFVYCFGLYQSFVFMFIFMCILSILLKYESKNNIRGPEVFKDCGNYFLIFIVVFILFELISKLVLYFLNDSAGTYLFEQILWGKEPILFIIKSIVVNIVKLVIGKSSLYHFFLIVFMILFFIKYCFDSSNTSITKIYKTIIVVALYAMPFVLNILMGGNVAVRTLFVLCYLNAFLLWHITLIENSKMLTLLTIISLVMPSGATFLLNKSVVNCYHEELKMAEQITEKIKENNYQDKKVVFIGKYNPNNEIKGEMLGKSFFEWDYQTEYQCNGRIFGFFDASGVHLNKASVDELNNIIPQVGSLKSWQEKKQIYLIDDIVVIKLS